MTTVKYHGEFPEGVDQIEQFGHVFERDGKGVEVKDDATVAKFAGNRFFEVSGKSDKDTVRAGRDEADKAEAQAIRAELDRAGIRTHHLTGLPKLRELKAEHDATVEAASAVQAKADGA